MNGWDVILDPSAGVLVYKYFYAVLLHQKKFKAAYDFNRITISITQQDNRKPAKFKANQRRTIRPHPMPGKKKNTTRMSLCSCNEQPRWNSSQESHKADPQETKPSGALLLNVLLQRTAHTGEPLQLTTGDGWIQRGMMDPSS